MFIDCMLASQWEVVVRIVHFLFNATPQLGVRQGDQVVPLKLAAPELPDDLAGFLEGGEANLKRAAAAAAAAPSASKLDYDGLQLLPPTLRPGKIICLGLNYNDHAAEAGMKAADYPVLFMRGASSLVAPDMPILLPKCSEKLDYEGELVAVIGKRARHVRRDQALSYVAGYSIFNDASIRDYQLRTSQWTIGKNFDGTGAFGPEFVSADELPAGAKGLKLETRLNGAVVQSANTDDMVFDVAQTVSLISECMTLEPGDLLVMGTPSGVGAARKPPLWMKAGDTVEVEVERIGVLRNTIREEVLN